MKVLELPCLESSAIQSPSPEAAFKFSLTRVAFAIVSAVASALIAARTARQAPENPNA